jgi:hypothetical protein
MANDAKSTPGATTSSEGAMHCVKGDNPDDCSSLVEFARATHFQNWDDNSGWFAGSMGGSVCTWKGISCTAQKRVSKIVLQKMV